ncbi:DNA-directed RNA polymerase III subunit RPC7 isoform X2 [Heliangelus exortis]|uniref:DNA-directed RNA polymerase III subunit RPC7 isoform X2 n=1 Tax=Heliangelus exortis TaxID=472823 RepID=UPI003A92A770
MLRLTKGRVFPLSCSWSPAVIGMQQAAVEQYKHSPEWTLMVQPVIERYSKKYQDSEKEHSTWTPDWRRLPREMKPKKKTKKAGAKPKKAKILEPKSNLDVLKKIEELEKKDDEEEKSEDEKDKMKDKEGEDDEEAEEPEEYDEEEHEEENDYISSYFEDGDDFGAGSDDNMDEATY